MATQSLISCVIKKMIFFHKNYSINDLLINDFLMLHTIPVIVCFNWTYQYSLFIKIITFTVKKSVRHVIFNLLNWIIMLNRLKPLIARGIRYFVTICFLCNNINFARVGTSLQSGNVLCQMVSGICFVFPRRRCWPYIGLKVVCSLLQEQNY